MSDNFFIGIPVPQTVVSLIKESGLLIKAARPTLRLVPGVHAHITVLFLGGLEKSQVLKFCEIMKNIKDSFSAFELSSGSLLCFPNVKHARVITYSVQDPARSLERLHNTLETSILDGGAKIDSKPWKPHVTIGRFHEPRNLSILSSSVFLKKPVSWTVNSMCMYRSEPLQSGGRRYSVLEEMMLNYAQ
ncbi:MAG: RNA 2',3'-cyclic phosphodiesterase [Patescibacteria group bacterium]|jgi:2'-5' RNA ligase